MYAVHILDIFQSYHSKKIDTLVKYFPSMSSHSIKFGWFFNLFLGNFLPSEGEELEGKGGARYGKWGGVCLMTQVHAGRIIIEIETFTNWFVLIIDADLDICYRHNYEFIGYKM